MDTQTARPQQPARERILDAALAVFSERGFEGGTIRQIAHKAGVAEGLIYHYFSNKEALLGELMRRESLLSWIPGATRISSFSTSPRRTSPYPDQPD